MFDGSNVIPNEYRNIINYDNYLCYNVNAIDNVTNKITLVN